jgi:hypothetical protein
MYLPHHLVLAASTFHHFRLKVLDDLLLIDSKR